MNSIVNIHTKASLERLIANRPYVVGIEAPDGAGKSHIAGYLASQVLGVTNLDVYPYFQVVNVADGKEGIEKVRQIQKFLKLSVPGTGMRRRAIIIESLDGLRHEAQNALLKMLEEPPIDSLIIVTYSSSQRILPTIQSRLQSLRVLPLAESDVTPLEDEYGKNEVTRAFRLSGGYAGLMLSLLAGDDSHPLTIAIARARELAAMQRYQRIAQVDKILKDDKIPVFTLIDAMHRLVEAGYRSSLQKSSDTKILIQMTSRLELLEKSLRDLQQNVQAKLVLDRLFMAF